MKSNIRSLIGGGAKLVALSILFVNSAIADSTSDARIQAYKANKLISEDVVIPTSTGAKETDNVVMFSKGTLSWKNDSAGMAHLLELQDKYNGWNLSDFDTAFGPDLGYNEEYDTIDYGWVFYPGSAIETYDEMRQYLSAIANGKLTSEDITSEQALGYLQAQLDTLCYNNGNYGPSVFGKFPCEGLVFPVTNLLNADLSECTGITAEQVFAIGNANLYATALPRIDFTGVSLKDRYLSGLDLTRAVGINATELLSAQSIVEAGLPSITFTGDEDFTGVDLSGTSLKNCTGITASQILQAHSITSAKLPAIAFTGTEDFSGQNFGGVDFSKCTGITPSQILSAERITSAVLPAITFTGNESFDGIKLTNTDLTQCTGLTGEQIIQCANIDRMKITSAQYESMKPLLSSKFAGKYIYVNKGLTRIK